MPGTGWRCFCYSLVFIKGHFVVLNIAKDSIVALRCETLAFAQTPGES